jgi:cardiolipin synthase
MILSDGNAVRLLRDGAVAYPAMLAAIARAEREILLEMYWIGADRVGERFRAALVERARSGVAVRVIYDAIGSFETPDSWWGPLLEAAAEVHEFSPVSPVKRLFRLDRLAYRDHRKNLVVDGVIGFVGGINIGEPWAPPDAPSSAWRDDAVEIRGPAVRAIRAAFFDVWSRCGRTSPGPVEAPPDATTGALRVLTNRFDGLPNRAIRRAYGAAIHASERSIDIASAYFLPGPIFLRALRDAARRGVRVRILVPEHSDVWIVGMAMGSLYGRLLADGVDVFVFQPRVLHAKTAIFDRRLATIGSHNLNSWSWRFDLECNVMIESADFAATVTESFEADLKQARALDLESWLRRPLAARVLAWLAAFLRPVL